MKKQISEKKEKQVDFNFMGLVEEGHQVAPASESKKVYDPSLMQNKMQAYLDYVLSFSYLKLGTGYLERRTFQVGSHQTQDSILFKIKNLNQFDIQVYTDQALDATKAYKQLLEGTTEAALAADPRKILNEKFTDSVKKTWFLEGQVSYKAQLNANTDISEKVVSQIEEDFLTELPYEGQFIRAVLKEFVSDKVHVPKEQAAAYAKECLIPNREGQIPMYQFQEKELLVIMDTDWSHMTVFAVNKAKAGPVLVAVPYNFAAFVSQDGDYQRSAAQQVIVDAQNGTYNIPAGNSFMRYLQKYPFKLTTRDVCKIFAKASSESAGFIAARRFTEVTQGILFPKTFSYFLVSKLINGVKVLIRNQSYDKVAFQGVDMLEKEVDSIEGKVLKAASFSFHKQQGKQSFLDDVKENPFAASASTYQLQSQEEEKSKAGGAEEDTSKLNIDSDSGFDSESSVEAPPTTIKKQKKKGKKAAVVRVTSDVDEESDGEEQEEKVVPAKRGRDQVKATKKEQKREEQVSFTKKPRTQL